MANLSSQVKKTVSIEVYKRYKGNVRQYLSYEVEIITEPQFMPLADIEQKCCIANEDTLHECDTGLQTVDQQRIFCAPEIPLSPNCEILGFRVRWRLQPEAPGQVVLFLCDTGEAWCTCGRISAFGFPCCHFYACYMSFSTRIAVDVDVLFSRRWRRHSGKFDGLLRKTLFWNRSDSWSAFFEANSVSKEEVEERDQSTVLKQSEIARMRLFLQAKANLDAALKEVTRLNFSEDQIVRWSEGVLGDAYSFGKMTGELPVRRYQNMLMDPPIPRKCKGRKKGSLGRKRQAPPLSPQTLMETSVRSKNYQTVKRLSTTSKHGRELSGREMQLATKHPKTARKMYSLKCEDSPPTVDHFSSPHAKTDNFLEKKEDLHQMTTPPRVKSETELKKKIPQAHLHEGRLGNERSDYF